MFNNKDISDLGLSKTDFLLVFIVISTIVLLVIQGYSQLKPNESTDDVRTREVEIIEPAEERFKPNDNHLTE